MMRALLQDYLTRVDDGLPLSTDDGERMFDMLERVGRHAKTCLPWLHISEPKAGRFIASRPAQSSPGDHVGPAGWGAMSLDTLAGHCV